MKNGNPAGQGGAFQRYAPESTGVTEQFASALWRPGDRVSVNYQDRADIGAEFTTHGIVDAADVAATVAEVQATYPRACIWTGVNPTAARGGRGRTPDVTRQAALYCELDDDDTTPEQMATILADLIRVLGEPGLVVASGHGRHIYWIITDGVIGDQFTHADAATLLARLYRIVCAIAAQHGAGKPDNVCELARVLRVPGTTNWKNTDAPRPVTVKINEHAAPLSIADARQRLDAADKLYPPEPAPQRELVSTPVAGGDGRSAYTLSVLNGDAAKLAATPPSGGEHGGRNKALNCYALRCHRLAIGDGITSRALIDAVLTNAAHRAGLPDSRIGPTLKSAAGAADRQGPAYPPDRGHNGDGWNLGDTTFDPGPGDDGAADEQPRYTDFAALLDAGLPDPPQPAILARADGVPIFYRRKRNELYGDPEDGKTMIALAAAAETLAAGGTALFLDLDNNGPVETARRLVMLGAPLDAIKDPQRFRHIEPADADDMRAVVDDCAGWADLAIIDCVGELVPLFTGSSDSADDYTAIMRRTSGTLERGGAAVILIDHPAKGRESRAYGAGGTMAKRRAVTGVSINVVRRQTFAPGNGGASDLWINKDRPGGLRQHCPTSEGRRQFAGTFILDPPDPGTGVAAWRVSTDAPATAATTVDPVVERHYGAAVKLAGTTTGATVAEVATIANGLPPGTPATRSQKETARRALDKLQFERRLMLVDGASPKRWELPE